ncbi:IS66-like element accessory protein TnpA [Bosea thiooxidans]
MSRFDLTLDPERVLRRVEVINGAGGRRRWSADEKARILEETLAPGAIVSEVARQHGLRPQQVFGWRRDARIDKGSAGAAMPPFVPAVIEAARPAPPPVKQPAMRRRRTAARSSDGIELEIDGVVVRVGSGASPKAIAAVIGALKSGS